MFLKYVFKFFPLMYSIMNKLYKKYFEYITNTFLTWETLKCYKGWTKNHNTIIRILHEVGKIDYLSYN